MPYNAMHFHHFYCSYKANGEIHKSALLGPVSTRDNRVFIGPLGRSLHLFAPTAHSLRSAPLRYARFARSLRSWARSLTSLTPSWDG